MKNIQQVFMENVASIAFLSLQTLHICDYAIRVASWPFGSVVDCFT